MKRLIALGLVGGLCTGCAGLSELVKAEGEAKNASYVVESRGFAIGVGFEKPAEGNIPLPWVGYKKFDIVTGIMAPGEGDALRYRNRRDMELSGGVEGMPGAEAVSGDETVIAIDSYGYLGGLSDAK